MALEPRSVARFYREFLAGLRSPRHRRRHLARIRWRSPTPIPFDQDEGHASYDPHHAQQLWRALVQVDRVLKGFQTGFVGKASPVHFFWGGFDLATTRFSGRPAPRHPGGVPNCPDWVMEEAESHQNVTVGWWPLGDAPGPAFYAYAYPEPDGFRTATVHPAGRVLRRPVRRVHAAVRRVRTAADPDSAVLEFLQSTYEAGADLGGWDRTALEPAELPSRPARRPWSLGR